MGRAVRLFVTAGSCAEIIAALWGFLRAWLYCEATVAEYLSLDPGFAMQIYAGLVAGGAVFLIGWNWSWINARRPSVRLSIQMADLEKTLRRANASLYSGITGEVSDAETVAEFSSIRRAAHRLEFMGIPHPGLSRSPAIWTRFLGRVIGDVGGGSIKAARCVWQDMRNDD